MRTMLPALKLTSVALFGIALLMGAEVRAADTWQDVKPGIRYLRRTTSNPAQDIHAAKIDLHVPNIGLRSSNDIIGDERKVNTLTFARNAGTVVAINGDWSDVTTPVGLAINNGHMWKSHIRTNNHGSHWGFMGCTVDKRCTLARRRSLADEPEFAKPHLAPFRFFQGIGANGVILLRNGNRGTACYDSARNPRSAAGIDAEGRYMWLVVVDGRRTGASGMTCDEMRTLMQGLGCHDAVMLDGGGSSTLVVSGAIKNTPSDGSPRTVANHWGIIYSANIDSRCRDANARWCEGSQIATCQGGRYLPPGDCAAFGSTCQEDGKHAFCVHPECPGGNGMATGCLDQTRIITCNDGQPSPGDCAAFGLVCGTDAQGAGCMQPACLEGPNSSFCAPDGQIGSCAQGVASAQPCPEGSTCAQDGQGPYCADVRCPPDGTGRCEGSTWQYCERGAFREVDCPAQGLVCQPEAQGCAPATPVDPADPVDPVDAGIADAAGPAPLDAGSNPAADASSSAGDDVQAIDATGGETGKGRQFRLDGEACSSAPGAVPGPWSVLGALLLLRAFWRRRPSHRIGRRAP